MYQSGVYMCVCVLDACSLDSRDWMPLCRNSLTDAYEEKVNNNNEILVKREPLVRTRARRAVPTTKSSLDRHKAVNIVVSKSVLTSKPLQALEYSLLCIEGHLNL